jgi:hypothetical protein
MSAPKKVEIAFDALVPLGETVDDVKRRVNVFGPRLWPLATENWRVTEIEQPKVTILDPVAGVVEVQRDGVDTIETRAPGDC